MNAELLSQLCQTQAENERMLEAIRDFKQKRKALDNSQSDAFGHQSKRVERRRQELKDSRQRLYSFLE